MTLLYLKAFHIVFGVSWFAGLFYIIRLFIYHVESRDMDEAIALKFQEQYKLMEKRLWFIITWPAMILTLGFGLAMLLSNLYYFNASWVYLKLIFVFLLVLYHIWCHRIYNQLKRDEFRYSSSKLRLINEIATLLLFGIVFVAVLKSTLTWIPAVLGFFGVAVLLMLGINFYKKRRERK